MTSILHITQSLRAVLVALSLSAVISTSASAQANVAPSDIYLTIFYYEEAAVKLNEKKDYDAALEKYEQAKKLLRDLSINHRTWKPEIVRKSFARISSNIDKIKVAKRKQAHVDNLVPELLSDGSSNQDNKGAAAPSKVKELEAEIEKREKILIDKTARSGSVEDLKRIIEQKNNVIKQLKSSAEANSASVKKRHQMLADEVNELRVELASRGGNTAALDEKQSEVNALNKKLDLLEAENHKLVKENQSIVDLARSKEKEIQVLQEKVNESSEARKADIQAANDKIRNLDGQLMIIKEEKDSAIRELETAIAKVRNQTTTNTAAPSDLFTGPNDFSEAQTIEQLKQERDEIIKRQEEVTAQKDREIKLLENYEDELKSALADAQKELSDAQELIKRFEEKSELNKEELNSTKSALTNAVFEQSDLATKVKEMIPNDEHLAEVSLLNEEIANLKRERELLLDRPLKSDVINLENRIKNISEDKRILSQNLSENEVKFNEAKERIEVLQEELVNTRKATKLFEENVNKERDLSNEIITTQRARLAAQNEEIKQKQRLLTAEKKKVTDLQVLLKQSNEQYEDLSNKYENLLTEHEQLRTLISGKSDVDQLKRENMKLRADYLTAKNEYDQLRNSDQSSEEDLKIAQQNYALMRSDLHRAQRIIDLEKSRADKLQNRLVAMQSEIALLSEKGGRSPEEIQMLKSLVDQNLKLQKARKIARARIMDEVKRLKIEDSRFISILDLAEAQEIVLTDEQRKYLANPNADDEFSFVSSSTPEERQQAQAKLSRDIKIYSELGREAYQKKRYAAAEEFFRLNLDAHPGHVPSMINLGVSRLNYAQSGGTIEMVDEAIESFEDAIANSGELQLPYAHQMLGYSYYLKQDLETATSEFNRSLEIDPQNAVAHIYLATIAKINEDTKEAENHLKSAISIDATLSDPHINLAALYTDQQKFEQALVHYRSALKKGASPDAMIEATLSKALPSGSF